jgi:hypothetical protein
MLQLTGRLLNLTLVPLKNIEDHRYYLSPVKIMLSTHTTIHDSTSEDYAWNSPVQDVVTSLPNKTPTGD